MVVNFTSRGRRGGAGGRMIWGNIQTPTSKLQRNFNHQGKFKVHG